MMVAAGTLDEGPAALPSSAQDVAPCGHMVSGQLHNERSRITGEQLRLFQDDAGDDDGCKADEVSRGGDPAAAAEQSTCDQADDGHLGTAGNEAGGHDRHTAVTLVLDGTGSHNTGNAAAGTNQNGDEALAGQAELAEDTVHDESNTGHVTNVFQDGKQEEQNQHLGNEAQNRADTGDDAVHDQAVQPASNANALQETAQCIGNDLAEQNIVGPVSCEGSDGDTAICNGSTHGQRVHEEHDQGKDWQSEDTVGNNLVDLIGNSQVLNASFLSDSLLNNSVDVSITLVGDDALGVIVHFLLAVCDVLVNVVNQRLVQLQLLLNLVITLEQLDGVPTQEAVINLALDGLFDMSDGMLNAASEHMGQLASLARLCSGNSHLSSLHAAFALQCADLNSLAAQLCAELLQVDLITILADQVDHVDGHNHRNAQLNQLGGQVQVTFNVGTINDIQDGIRLFIDQVTTGHNFLQGVGGQGVDTGQVLNDNVLLTFQAAFLLFNRNARPVADILVRTG